MFSMNFDFTGLVILAAVLLISIAFHEAAHAFAAYRLGDSTAKHEGRLTLNPFRHLDLFGTIAFLVAQFGWGKPVPVDARNLSRPRQDMAIVALAGPLANLLLAFVAVGLFVALATVTKSAAWLGQDLFERFLQSMIMVNAMLAVFNLIPVPPLDGGNILTGILPKRVALRVEDALGTHGFVILAVLLGIDIFFRIPIITGPVFFLANLIVTGFVAIFDQLARLF